MTIPLEPGDENFASASSQLDAGLRTCRTVLSNYRSLLAGDAGAGTSERNFSDSDDTVEDPLN